MSENLNNEQGSENETSTAVTAVDGVGNADTLEPGSHGDETHNSDEESTGEIPQSEEQQTFPRSYVEKLRKENAGYRERAGKVDDLEQQLHAALVRLDGRLADPADLEFDPEHLEDGEALAAAVTALVEKKPGLKAQQFSGDAGAGKRGSGKKPPADLISIIRGM